MGLVQILPKPYDGVDMPKKLGSWDLHQLLENVHNQVEGQLDLARKTLGHPTDKGDSSESVWIELLNTYLPRRYHTLKGHVADSAGNFSQQIDLIIHDRHFTPLIFTFKDVHVVPVESIYAIFECKQQIDSGNIRYAKEKVSTVRKLNRTNGKVTGKGVTGSPPPLLNILGGILALDSKWEDPMGDVLQRHLADSDESRLLDIGCVASKGIFVRNDSRYETNPDGKHATRFLFRLIEKLQSMGTVPAIEMHRYEPFLDDVQVATMCQEL